MENDFYLTRLREELSRRCARNPRYSIRSFARSLGVSASILSRVLSGKRIPTPKLTEKLTSKLALDPAEEQRFWESIARNQQARRYGRKMPVLKTATRAVSSDTFSVVADWYHYAILELTFTKGFRSDPQWIASQLGISVTEAKLAIDRLLAVGLLRLEGKRLIKTDERIDSEDKSVTTAAHARRYKQMLDKMTASVEQDPIDQRSMSFMTVAINPANLPRAKALIENFTYELCDLLEEGDRSRVYEFNLNLFPVQKEKA